MKFTNKMKAYKLLFAVAIIVFIFDQLTKAWILSAIPIGTYWPAESIKVIENFFYIVHIGNEGAAWGMLNGQRTFLTLFALVALFAIYKFRYRFELKRLSMQIAFGLLIGGVIGNLLDRLIHGHVIDFIDFHLPFSIPYILEDGRYPAFNIADCGIVIGVFTYTILSLLKTSKERKATLYM